MNTVRQPTDNSIILEAPGDLLSELLGVIGASLLLLEREDVCTLPSVSGHWYVLSPEHGSVNLAWGDRAWTLSVPQAAVFPGNEELSLLAGEESAVRLLSLIGTAADRVFSACQKEGGLYFENGGIAIEHVFSLLSSGGASASEASEAAYGLLVVEAALGIIRRDFAFLDGIGELAERLEVSQEYLTRSFCRYIGITPGKYLTRVRIENARLLLRQGRHSVQFVSEACGFTNANYFARVFRTAVGMNPAEYARRQPSESDAPRDEHLYVL